MQIQLQRIKPYGLTQINAQEVHFPRITFFKSTSGSLAWPVIQKREPQQAFGDFHAAEENAFMWR